MHVRPVAQSLTDGAGSLRDQARSRGQHENSESERRHIRGDDPRARRPGDRVNGLCRGMLALGAAYACFPLAWAQQQKKVAHIGVMANGTRAAYATRLRAFGDGLRELGYVEGKNLSSNIGSPKESASCGQYTPQSLSDWIRTASFQAGYWARPLSCG